MIEAILIALTITFLYIFIGIGIYRFNAFSCDRNDNREFSAVFWIFVIPLLCIVYSYMMIARLCNYIFDLIDPKKVIKIDYSIILYLLTYVIIARGIYHYLVNNKVKKLVAQDTIEVFSLLWVFSIPAWLIDYAIKRFVNFISG